MRSPRELSAAKWIASACGLGFIPFIPATWTSAIVCVAAWFCPDAGVAAALIACTWAGLWACSPSRTVFASDDPKQFVMDEVCGMMLSVLWLPRELGIYIAAFILFRALDAWKPWPIIVVQRRPEPWSIVGDDLLAGLFTNALLRIYLSFIK